MGWTDREGEGPAKSPSNRTGDVQKECKLLVLSIRVGGRRVEATALDVAVVVVKDFDLDKTGGGMSCGRDASIIGASSAMPRLKARLAE